MFRILINVHINLVSLVVALTQLHKIPTLTIHAPTSPIQVHSYVSLKCIFTVNVHLFGTDINRFKWNRPNEGRFQQTADRILADNVDVVTKTLTINKVECEDETDFVCSVSLFYNRRTKQNEKLERSVTLVVEQDPEKPSKLTFTPNKIKIDTEVTFTCTGNVGKPAKQLELFLKHRYGSGDTRTNLRVTRKTTPDSQYTCVTIETITAKVQFDETYYDHLVTCQVMSDDVVKDGQYSRIKDLGFINPDTSTITPRLTISQHESGSGSVSKSGSGSGSRSGSGSGSQSTTKSPKTKTKETPLVAIILGAIGGVILFVLAVFLIVLYVNNTRKQTEHYVEEPQRSPSYMMGGSRTSLRISGSKLRTAPVAVFAEEDDIIMLPRSSRSNLAPARRPSQIEYEDDDRTSRRSRRSSRHSRRHDYDDDYDDGTRRKSRRSKRRRGTSRR